MNPKRMILVIPAVISLLTMLGNSVVMLVDGNPDTNPDWNVFVTTCTTALAVLFARPNNVTSEEAGLKSSRGH